MTRRPWRGLRAGPVLGLLAVLVAGCGLFKPATPEPGGGGTVLLPNYADPESCLFYMRIGIERQDNLGQDAYLGALGDTTNTADRPVGFHAFFDAVVWNDYVGVKPADWDLSHEAQFLSGFVRLKTVPYQMNWLPDIDHPYDDKPDDDHRILHRRYEVRALQPSSPVLIAVGYADLYFARISGTRWALTRWQDRVDPAVGAKPADADQQTFGSRRLNAGAGG